MAVTVVVPPSVSGQGTATVSVCSRQYYFIEPPVTIDLYLVELVNGQWSQGPLVGRAQVSWGFESTVDCNTYFSADVQFSLPSYRGPARLLAVVSNASNTWTETGESEVFCANMGNMAIFPFPPGSPLGYVIGLPAEPGEELEFSGYACNSWVYGYCYEFPSDAYYEAYVNGVKVASGSASWTMLLPPFFFCYSNCIIDFKFRLTPELIAASSSPPRLVVVAWSPPSSPDRCAAVEQELSMERWPVPTSISAQASVQVVPPGSRFSIYGRLTTYNGVPVPGQQLQLMTSWGPTYFTQTGSDGSYIVKLQAPPQPGSYSVQVVFPGAGGLEYSSYTLGVSVGTPPPGQACACPEGYVCSGTECVSQSATSSGQLPLPQLPSWLPLALAGAGALAAGALAGAYLKARAERG